MKLLIKIILLMGVVVAAQPALSVSRPNKVLFKKLSPEIDNQKTIAGFYSSGYLMTKTRLFGHISPGWIGARDTTRVNWPVVWSKKSESKLEGIPFEAFGKVYVTNAVGDLICFDIETGERAFKLRLDSHSRQEMILVGTKILVTTATQKIYLIDAATGNISWISDLGFPDELAVDAGVRPFYQDGMVYTGTTKGEIVAIEADTGKLAWRHIPDIISNDPISDVIGGIYKIRDYLVYTRYDGVTGALKLKDNTTAPILVWSEDFGSVSANEMRDGRLYIGDLFGAVTVVDPMTGKKIWTQNVTSSPVYDLISSEKALLVTSYSGEIASILKGDGTYQWSYNLEANVAGKPQAVLGNYYFFTRLGNIYGFKFD